MGKVGKVKKREPSLHSRSARRNASPPPKLKGAPATSLATDEAPSQPWLYSAHDAGISKKKKTKALTRQQRLRHERGMEKAGVLEDKLQRKIEGSKLRSRKVQGRRKGWEDINGVVGGVVVTKREGSSMQGGDNEGMDGVEEEVDDGDGQGEEDAGVEGGIAGGDGGHVGLDDGGGSARGQTHEGDEGEPDEIL